MGASVKRLGVFGGSFDPIHLGHLIIAQEALWQCNLDAILFMVTARPPHKQKPEAPVEDRFRMVELAIEGKPGFEPSRIEIDRGGESYTAESLRELRRIYPDALLCLIVGADSVLDFKVWKEPEAVIDMAQVAVAPRPGFDLSKLEPRLEGKTIVFESPMVALSSTMIRKRLHEGKPVRFLVPEVVEQYICERGLYSD